MDPNETLKALRQSVSAYHMYAGNGDDVAALANGEPVEED